MRMDYKEFEVEDFLQDEFFVDWVLHPNHESDHFWLHWLNGHPEKRPQAELAREMIKSMHYRVSYTLDADEYSALMEEVLQHSEPARVKPLNIAFRNAYRVAATLILILGLLFTVYKTYFNSETPLSDQTPVSWTLTSTDYGQKKTILLPDGTKVILNSGSKIEYPEHFTSDERMVRFEGEAFFDVAHNPQRPFIIQSGALTTRVLGTSFNLKNFEGEEEVSVSVVTGKVEVKSKTGQTALLLPNEMGVFNKTKQDISRKHFNKDKHVAWTQGVLLFENEELNEIFSRLEKWYGVRFIIKDHVKLQGKYSGEYKRKSLELVLEGLSYTSNFNYQINQKTITIL